MLDRERLKPWLLPGALIAACLLLQLLDLELAIRYDRQAIGAGQWWRMLSANFIHLGWNHLLLNVAGALLVFILFNGTVGALQWLAVILAGSLGIAIAVYWLNPDLYWYVGLSGVLHSMFACGAVAEFRRAPLFATLLLIGLIAKLMWEQLVGSLPGTAETVGGEVVVDAHLYGAIVGLLFGVAWQIVKTLRHKGDHE